MRIVTVIENTYGNNECSFEHGLSIYVETEKHKLLLDTGATDAFAENAEKLGIDLKDIDIVVLSHGHYDHAGGILPFSKINTKAKIYMQKGAKGDFYHGERYIGIDKCILKLSSVSVVQGDLKIDDELFLYTGVDGKRFLPKSNQGLCILNQSQMIQDDFSHEQYLVVTCEGKSILISGCAHNGILNILDKYRNLYQRVPDVVISGFHMMKNDDYDSDEKAVIEATAKELNRLDTLFYTGHCTGQKAFDIMKEIMGDKLKQIHSGEEIIFDER